jgi:Tol biopolymer transport system component
LQTTDWPANRRVVQIWEIRADGGGLRRLHVGRQQRAQARWSPDGSTIAYLSGGNIFLMGADGQSTRQLSRHATAVSDIAWQPDGSAIYFLATDPPTDAERARERLRGDIIVLDEFRQRHLWKIAVADAQETRITSGAFSVYAFKIGPGGRRIIFSRKPTPLLADTGKMELWSLDPATGASVQLTHNDVPEEGGELSPDGTQILFLCRANDRLEPYYNANLFLMPSGGGTPRAADAGVSIRGPERHLGHGRPLIWMVVNMGVHSELFQVDLATRKPRQVTSGEHSIVSQFWSMTGGRHVLMFDEPARIGEIWTLAAGCERASRSDRRHEYLDRDFAMPRQERIEWKGADGATSKAS